MIVRINGNPIMDQLNEWADQLVGAETEFIFNPIMEAVKAGALYAIHTLNSFSVEIITLSIVVCGFGMMVGPLIGGGDKWFGRLFAVGLGGVIWRLII